MSLQRAAPGPQLGTGRLRVDAARAIAKLREYQLADRTEWVLEAIRAAVASGATRLELAGDGTDVWLSWHGPPWPAEDLPRLFDELVSPEAAADRHHVRLLAAGVNSALGMNPAYVDVIAIAGGDAPARRARYTPDVLDEQAELGDESALRELAAVEVPAPRAEAGMLVHLHRRVSLATVANLFWHSEPPEFSLARAACADLAVPLVIGDEIFTRANARDLVRLALGDELEGFIAIGEPLASGSSIAGEQRVGAIMEVAERGVVLARYTIDLGAGLDHAPVPLRLFVDAPRMPTNASRSQVRRDRHPIAAAEARAKAMLPAAIDALAEAVRAGKPAARTAALALFAGAIADNWRATALAVPAPLSVLAALPLLRDAVGIPHPLTAAWTDAVHVGRTPHDPELAPWLGNVPWIPRGDAAERLLVDTRVDPNAMPRLLRWAKRQRRAHQRFFDHDARTPAVTTPAVPRLRVALGVPVAGSCVGDYMFAGLTGEVCLLDPDAKTQSELVVLLEGREIERLQFDSPIAFAVTIDAPDVTPTDRYRGIERDDEYDRVERAMRAGVLRAVEVLARDRPSARSNGEARIIRGALALTRELQIPFTDVLATTPAWPTAGGGFVSLAELAGQRAIGYAFGDEAVIAPAGRIVITGDDRDRQLLGRLQPALRIVAYRTTRSQRPAPRALAQLLLGQNQLALGVRDDGDGELIGAIMLSANRTSTMRLFHRGVPLGSQPYAHRLVPVMIAVDSDALIPNERWDDIDDDAGLGARDFQPWERALLRTLARAMIGDRDADLHGRAPLGLTDDAGRALCAALAAITPELLLGADLIAALRAYPLVRVLGEDIPWTIDEVAAAFPVSIPYVDATVAAIAIPFADAISTPIATFKPIVADPITAQAIAKLAGRVAGNGTGELEMKRRVAQLDARLAKHREKATVPLELPAAAVPQPLASTIGPGFVGLSPGAFSLTILVEGRPFQHVELADGIPVSAIVDVDPTHTDDTFESVPEHLVHTVVSEIVARVPALIGAVVSAQPHAIADEGPARRLLFDWLTRMPLEAPLRAVLCAVDAFPTIQGPRISLETAAMPRGIISTAAWHDPWAAHEADPVHALDAPILQVGEPGGEVAMLITYLHRGAVVDMTDEVARLQSTRRIARGLLKAPTLDAIPAELKRALADLGDGGKLLGHGELGFPAGKSEAIAFVHVNGVPRARQALDVKPAVHLALEAPDLVELDTGVAAVHPLNAQVQALIPELVRAVVGTGDPAMLPPALRRELGVAMLAGRLALVSLGEVPVFETTTGWVTGAAIAQQLELFGDLWVVTFPVTDTPLDERRLIIKLKADELAAAGTHIQLANGERELALDGRARFNRARPNATTLEPPPYPGPPPDAIRSDDEAPTTDILAMAMLPGDGQASPRGTVAVLMPGMTDRHGLYPHRAMHPFERMPDPCPWPTLAMIDDARLVPSRDWARPETAGALWSELATAVTAASERALAAAAAPPAEALVTYRIGTESIAAALPTKLPPKSQLRGALWLVPIHRANALAWERPLVEITHDYGRAQLPAPHGVSIGGRLFGTATHGWDVNRAVAAITANAHGRLLRLLIARTDLPADAITAHVVHGLVLKRIPTSDAFALVFTCFVPPLHADGVAQLFANDQRVPVIQPGETSDEPLAIIDDGTDTAYVVLSCLGKRAYRVTRAAVAAPAFVAADVRPAHVLRGVLNAIEARLAGLGVRATAWAIDDGAKAMITYDGTITLAGTHPRLLAIAAAQAAGTAWSAAAIDALVAHVMTVLNIALTEITESMELAALRALLGAA